MCVCIIKPIPAIERPTLAEWPVSATAAAVVCYLGSGSARRLFNDARRRRRHRWRGALLGDQPT